MSYSDSSDDESVDDESIPPRIRNLADPLHSEIVSIVSSPLAVTKPQQNFSTLLGGSRFFEYLTSFHTTHWGLRIGDRFIDLKRFGTWPNARTSIEVADIGTRKEREILSTEALGITHFHYHDLEDIGNIWNYLKHTL